MSRPRTETSTPICRIDVTAFAGVMFALVGMFLLPAMVVVDSPRNAAQVAVDLANASNAKDLQGADREDALLVAITRDGHVWFDTDQILPENLATAIRERVSSGAERKVYIRADMRTRYGLVVRVLNCMRAAGIEKVAFVVNERTRTPTLNTIPPTVDKSPLHSLTHLTMGVPPGRAQRGSSLATPSP